MQPALVPCGKRQQRDVPRLLDGARQTALVCGANAAQPPRNNLAALGHKLLQQPHVAVRNPVDLLGAELADLLAAEKLSPSAGTAGASARTTRAGARSGRAARSVTNFVELRPTTRTLLPGFLQPSCFLLLSLLRPRRRSLRRDQVSGGQKNEFRELRIQVFLFPYSLGPLFPVSTR